MTPDTHRELTLPATADSASRAREEVRDWLGESHPAYEQARLAVSELVTNAIRHPRQDPAQPPGRVNLRLVATTDRVRIEVTDQGRTGVASRPCAQEASPLAEGGRGLLIVDLLSEGRWDTYANPDGPGRTVWCEISVQPVVTIRATGE
ncbi:ATP-binding protein [Sphaerisporangium rubeum]|uniref:Anti-sigma regulatory factor (Ser/Thr protein kinase) n=1 Tax=Sphaerisporangium rubeum TaxID=321317 RepID=A0A7X0M9E5_9ACTN|nr:ATP-binding protein [Sphaerisporangium rubeum]MBB6476387.1 anti-sigma regulatory factor (Ser/Thr protein kinase) [Sphaerisporangium rubeum]